MEEFEIVISDVCQYLSIIFDLEKNLKRNAMNYEILLYRGHPDKKYKLLPSIARNRRFSCDFSILDEERNLIELAKYKLPDVFNQVEPIDLLAKLQHYGIPTRLLDVTTSPLVALYFACSQCSELDGEVILFKDDQYDIGPYPVINALAESYKFLNSTFYPLSLFYNAVISQPYFIEQRHSIDYKTDEGGGNWIAGCCDKTLFVLAKESANRQKNQFGQFILFPNEIKTDNSGHLNFNKVIKEMPKDKEHITKRVIIPMKSKEEILSQLHVLGITEATLFSDSIDKVCKGILEDRMQRVQNKNDF